MRRRLKRRSATARKPGGAAFDPLSLSPVAWWDAADFTGTEWPDKIAAKSLNGTATVSTDGSKSYPAVSLNGTQELILNGTGTWNSVFGTGAWEVVVCFNPSPLTINAEGILSAQRAGLTKPQLFGAGLKGVALMRSGTRAHLDGKEAARRPRAATWEESASGDTHHHYFATPIVESATQITRHGREGFDAWASGYKAATLVGNTDDATNGGIAALSVGGNGSGHYTGKISHIFCFDRKLTDTEAASLSGWIDDQVGVQYLPHTVDTEVYATMMNIDFDKPNAAGINDGMVVDIDIVTAWDIGDGGFPRPPIGVEAYNPASRPNLITTSGHTGLEFNMSTADTLLLTSSTTYSYPGSYATFKSIFGPGEGYGCAVVRFDTFVDGGASYPEWPSILCWLSAPLSGQGLKYKKISGVTCVHFFDAEVAVAEDEICLVEFGLKTVSGKTRSYVRVNNGSVVMYEHTGLRDLAGSDLVCFGSREGSGLSAQHVVFRLQTCVDTQNATAQNKWRDRVAADFGLSVASTDLFA